MEENGLLQYDDIESKIMSLKTAVEDMECFVLLLHEVKDNSIPTGAFVSVKNLSDLDTTIQQFKSALNAPNANKDALLQMNLQELLNLIRFSDVKLSDQQYEDLQNLVTEGGKLFGFAPYQRKILLDHHEGKESGTVLSALAQNQDEESSDEQ